MDDKWTLIPIKGVIPFILLDFITQEVPVRNNIVVRPAPGTRRYYLEELITPGGKDWYINSNKVGYLARYLLIAIKKKESHEIET